MTILNTSLFLAVVPFIFLIFVSESKAGGGPPVAACCLPDDSCIDTIPGACDFNGGIWQGGGTSCATFTCSTTDGACCFVDALCTITDADSCEFDLGSFQGGGTTCGGVFCPPFPPDQACFVACSSSTSPIIVKCSEQPSGVCDGDEGTSGDDVICGSSGADNIQGGKGNDLICGNDGNDTISGGQDNDCIFGENDHDIINGGKDNDLIQGDDGDDYLDGGMGSDAVFGGDGNDDIFGGTGHESSEGGTTGIARRCTGLGPQLSGGGGNDYIEGGSGNDLLRGGNDVDECYGGPDDDDFLDCEIEDTGPNNKGGTQVLVDDDCICSEKDKSTRVFTSFDDGADCTNPDNLQPTIWVKMKGQTSTIYLYTLITFLDAPISIDFFLPFEYCGSGDWLYFNDSDNGFPPLVGSNGTFLVEVLEANPPVSFNFINYLGKSRYIVDLP